MSTLCYKFAKYDTYNVSQFMCIKWYFPPAYLLLSLELLILFSAFNFLSWFEEGMKTKSKMSNSVMLGMLVVLIKSFYKVMASG